MFCAPTANGIEDFIEEIDTPVDSYYRGNTSNGIYNDNTGEAYLVRYNEDGTVKVLYKGIIRKGNHADSKKIDYVTREQIDQIIEGMEFSCDMKAVKK